jgi:hypothetical protein
MPVDSAKPEKLLLLPQPGLSGKELEIYSLVLEKWPTSAIEIAEYFSEDLGSREARRKASTKYAYYLQKLIGKRLLLSKRVGNALVVWPVKAEKLRTVYAILESREVP